MEQNPDRFADSAGRPWEGRSFEANSFSQDDGSAPRELIKAIAGFQLGEHGAEVVVDAIRSARLLVPLLAALGESEIGSHGQLVDKSAELSIVTVKSPDDQDALVVFSSVEAMGRWNSAARPVPTDAIRVTLAAASEGSTRVVLDPGSESEFVLRRPAIAKIAQALPWMPPEQSAELRVVIEQSIAEEDLVVGFELGTDDPRSRLEGAELRVSLKIKSGVEPEVVRDLVDRITVRWSQSEVFAEAVDSVSVKLIAS